MKDKMKDKIAQLYKSEFQSSPSDVSQKEMDFIIKHNCKCSYCEEEIWEMSDFPDILIEENELLCEDCYSEKYRKGCPICENSYDTRDFESEHYVLNEEDAKDENKEPGVYRKETDTLVVSIRINELKEVDCGSEFSEVWTDDICLDCSSKLIRKDNCIKSHGSGIPIILMKKYEQSDYLRDLTLETIKIARVKLIHRRITVRGMIERGNKQI